MRHLFIINPAAKKVKGHVNAIKNEIVNFFKAYPDLHYDIYLSSWCRDAVTFIRRYIMEDTSSTPATVRVHAIGGSGTLFEVVNGVIGFDNVEIAAYPYGIENVFLRYFGDDKLALFSVIKSQVFDGTIPIDIIRRGNNYGISYGIVGFEASCAVKGDRMIEWGLPADFSYIASALSGFLFDKNLCHSFEVDIDGQRLDGRYLSILIANSPCYGEKFYPAVDAHPDSGKLEFYLIKEYPRLKYLVTTADYLKGNHDKLETMLHCSGKRITISAEETICMNIDNEPFYGTSAEFELLPGAVKFVCPEKINLGELPLIYKKPKGGTGNG